MSDMWRALTMFSNVTSTCKKQMRPKFLPGVHVMQNCVEGVPLDSFLRIITIFSAHIKYSGFMPLYIIQNFHNFYQISFGSFPLQFELLSLTSCILALYMFIITNDYCRVFLSLLLLDIHIPKASRNSSLDTNSQCTSRHVLKVSVSSVLKMPSFVVWPLPTGSIFVSKISTHNVGNHYCCLLSECHAQVR